MKLNGDPTPALREAAAAHFNGHFNRLAQPHHEAAWANKRVIASVVLSGKNVPEHQAGAAKAFAQEATLRGIGIEALAQTVLSKPDVAAERELERQRIMLRIEAATTPAELDDITKNTKVSP